VVLAESVQANEHSTKGKSAGGASPWSVPYIALLVVDSNNKLISEGIQVYGHGKKMADVLNSYDARLQSEN
jgi:hypothetical protein